MGGGRGVGLMTDEEASVFEALEDEVDALVTVELAAILVGQQVFTLAFLRLDDWDAVLVAELGDVVVKTAGQRLDPVLSDRLLGAQSLSPGPETTAGLQDAGMAPQVDTIDAGE